MAIEWESQEIKVGQETRELYLQGRESNPSRGQGNQVPRVWQKVNQWPLNYMCMLQAVSPVTLCVLPVFLPRAQIVPLGPSWSRRAPYPPTPMWLTNLWAPSGLPLGMAVEDSEFQNPLDSPDPDQHSV